MKTHAGLRLVGLVVLVSVMSTACVELSPEEIDARAQQLAAALLAPAEGGSPPPYDLGGREVRIAVENSYPPFNFIDAQAGEPVGWDYDVGRAICQTLHCTPVFVEVKWDEIFEALTAGQFDVVADGVVITSERERVADFSTPYMINHRVIVVRKGQTAIMDQASLVAGHAVVGVVTEEEATAELVGENRVRRFTDTGQAVEALLAGDVGALILNQVGAWEVLRDRSEELKVVGDLPVIEESLALMFPPGSELIEPVNYALQALVENGALQEINRKWWPGEW